MNITERKFFNVIFFKDINHDQYKNLKQLKLEN